MDEGRYLELNAVPSKIISGDIAHPAALIESIEVTHSYLGPICEDEQIVGSFSLLVHIKYSNPTVRTCQPGGYI